MGEFISSYTLVCDAISLLSLLSYSRTIKTSITPSDLANKVEKPHLPDAEEAGLRTLFSFSCSSGDVARSLFCLETSRTKFLNYPGFQSEARGDLMKLQEKVELQLHAKQVP